jgi:hypothetical protein
MKSLNRFVYNLLFIVILTSFSSSCTDEKTRSGIGDNKPKILDTLRFTEEMRGNSGLGFKFHFKAFFDDFSRNNWVPFSVYGKGEMINILKHSNLFVQSEDSTIHIRKVSGFNFEIMVDSNFNGCYPLYDEKIISYSPIIQPHKGYIFDSYWLDKPISYPDKTRISINHLKIE